MLLRSIQGRLYPYLRQKLFNSEVHILKNHNN
jgi:hypothetical protein